MSFDQQNNSRDNKNSVNTRGVQFFNKESIYSSTLSVGYWNEFLSIKINPALPKDQQTDAKVYDYTKSVVTVLSIEKASTLIREIDENIIPAIVEEREKSISIPTATDSLLSVGTVNQNGTIRPYIAIHKGIKENRIPQLSIFYEFNNLNIIDDYNETTGEYQVRNTNLSEFLAFTYILKSSVQALSHAYTHSQRVVGKWNNDKLNGMIEEIVSKLGISSAFTNKGYYSKGKDNLWTTGTQNNDSSNMVEHETLQNIDELNEFMN